MCLSELRGLGAANDEIRELGGTMVAISSDSVKESAKARAKARIPFPLLADSDCKVIKEFGLLHAQGGPSGQDVAVPAHVLVDKSGKIAWSYVSGRVQDRPDADQDTAAIRSLPRG